jgi:putative FmdB family regulatory protein
MPIYAYRCTSCGHAQDVLQKMSDPVLTVCPACGAPSYVKQLTAAGFQLKGSGWYVTDFKGGNKPAAKPAEGGDGAAASGDKSSDKAAERPAEGSSAQPAAPATAAEKSSAPAPAPTPAAAPPSAAS